MKLSNYLQRRVDWLNDGIQYEVYVVTYIDACIMVDLGFAVTYQPKFHRYVVTRRKTYE